MTPDLARADRAAAVRGAARSWRRAGIIDEVTFAAVEGRFADDRVRVGPVFRVLLFVFTLVAVSGAFGFIALTLAAGQGGVVAALALAAGGALMAVTDLLVGRYRRRQGGIEAATSLAAIGLLLGAAAWVLFFRRNAPAGDSAAWISFFSLAAALAGAAAWRWGYPLYAGAGAVAALMAVCRLPAGRALWIALPLAAAPLLERLTASPRLPPAHRSSATAALVVALAGLYAAVHVGSWDSQLLESIAAPGRAAAPPHGGLLWWSAVAATALLPVLILAAGLRRRRRPLLAAGAVAAVASLLTLHTYVDLVPAWLALILAGALLVAVVLALRRYLDSGPAQERHGYTAAPLLADRGRQGLVEAGAALLTLPAAARPVGGEPSFSGDGGRSGGAGATGEF